MENDKKDFNNTISELETLAGNFKNFSDVDNYEQIAQDAKNIKQRIDEANEYAKKRQQDFTCYSKCVSALLPESFDQECLEVVELGG